MQAQLASAAARAQAILISLNQRDIAGLQQEIGRIEAAQTRTSDALEAERLDLLAGIAAELSAGGYSEVCARLLLHTAATVPAASFRVAPSATLLQ